MNSQFFPRYPEHFAVGIGSACFYQHHKVLLWQCRFVQAEGLAYRAFDSIALHGISYIFFRNDKSKAWMRKPVGASQDRKVTI